jgi:putative transposase
MAMGRLLLTALRTVLSGLLGYRHLVAENLVLRQQLATFKASGRRPRIRTMDRAFWVVARRLWSRWADALVIVKPETVVRWHRRGFRLYWAWISRPPRRPGRRPITDEARHLIRRMAVENRWGAPRIHGELLMLGFDVSERSVSRYLRSLRRRPEARQGWRTFLRNHREAIAAMDFFTVGTVSFRVLYVWFAIRHGRREVVHFNVTEHPSETWVVQQLREAFPYETAVRHLIFDRDSTFSARVVRTVKTMGVVPARTSYRSPWQNGVAERFVGNVRGELLDHVIVLDEQHLRRLLREYVQYYLQDRTHCSLAKETPARRSMQPRPSATAEVFALPRVGGLHHRYEWRDAA